MAMSTDKKSKKSTGASDEMKRRFREVLDKKKQQNSQSGKSHLDSGSAVNSTHGSASTQREFRRKSG